MSRKSCRRRHVTPLPPPGMRPLPPKLVPSQVRDLALTHVVDLDAIARGCATPDTLWNYVGAILTWDRVARLLQVGVPEMDTQVAVAHRLIRRYRSTGKVGFTGLDYQAARTGLQVMDGLITIVDLPTAMLASEWAEQTTNELKGSP
jgi:hypothetical protein